jgi:ABC-type lipoprotein release transport system permease subunit
VYTIIIIIIIIIRGGGEQKMETTRTRRRQSFVHSITLLFFIIIIIFCCHAVNFYNFMQNECNQGCESSNIIIFTANTTSPYTIHRHTDNAKNVKYYIPFGTTNR